MIDVNQIELKVYLKCVKKPFVIVLENETQLSNIVEMLETNKLVKLGGMIFNVSELKYIEIC